MGKEKKTLLEKLLEVGKRKRRKTKEYSVAGKWTNEIVEIIEEKPSSTGTWHPDYWVYTYYD